jgi:hypothetical protein
VAKAKPNKQRERRIKLEIVAEAHDAEERARGWYSCLEERLRFPFPGKCIAPRAISPLRKGQEAEAVVLAPAEEVEHETFVTITRKPSTRIRQHGRRSRTGTTG